MKRKGIALDLVAVEKTQHDLQSYQIKNNNCLQLRAFLLNESGMFTTDGRKILGSVTKEDIDCTSRRIIGRGASGTVRFARLKDGTPVALKHIPITSKLHRDEVDRELSFFSSQSNSPFVMKNLGAFWDSEEGAIVIPMEWMAYTLKDMSYFWEGIEETILRDIFFQVVSGLVYLHDTKRVIHRDLKPSNLLIRDDGYVKISDFGVSKLVQTLDVSSTYVGTMYFMAPERLEQTVYSFSSDIWSLGLTVIATVTGKNPWAPPDEMNLFQLLGKIAGETTPSLPEKPVYSEEARDFIKKCLVRDPQERPSAAELLKHPFFEGCTEELAVKNVKMAVEHMTHLINNDAKKTEDLKRSQEDVAKEVNIKLEMLGVL
ncbi:mitogen-activated protein kinase kinase, putative [Trypanosoma equiperdum]|uniref:mitogen-activated protein kinase kinase n=3 Tax=Trypanozoon TaxID=39700 RepID=Q582P9_TRYB2|nr:protein kinase, putative [Trypanosoma brucei gambiense DAL972]XP_844078.1 protein kinase, putative [Trypanosoma brucei brucei TREU927]AAX80655.1 protein kinase, putative [Trypanosoma brucei]SCU68727.1 mitogen-activated protein kinase kinase, putative [Trypanosoma equiperdum]AAZ10519.1 protein kinase, putative [Trypanosoma brucei brucei TREU927]CBH10203.1 protein kinase, putative [Trypanosoma brucei gambiense DAL972]|eukprot:XP_011772493.1 protein kinase, putative [Trypanosoma brucei gambiense DAL972]